MLPRTNLSLTDCWSLFIMAESSNGGDLKEEKSFFWNPENLALKQTLTAASNKCRAIESPITPYGENEFCFALGYSPVHQGNYVLSLIDKTGKEVSRPFDATAYLYDESGLKVFERNTVENTPVCLLSFGGNEVPRGCRRLNFVIIFHGDNFTGNSEKDPGLESLSEDFYELLMKGYSSNVTLMSRNQARGAHKSILEARSDVLNAMLQNRNVLEVDMDSEILDKFLVYLYTAQLSNLTSETAWPLKNAAKQFNVPSLLQRCEDFLVASLSEDNALEMLVSADADKDDDLKQQIMAFILNKKMPEKTSDKWSLFLCHHEKLAIELLMSPYKR